MDQKNWHSERMYPSLLVVKLCLRKKKERQKKKKSVKGRGQNLEKQEGAE